MEHCMLLKLLVTLSCIVLIAGFETKVKSSKLQSYQKLLQALSVINNKNVSSHQNSIIFGNNHPKSGNHLPLAVHGQTTGHYHPTTRRHQPTTGRRQPTTGRYQPTTGRRQPTTGRYQPTTGRRQPTTGRYQPTTGRRQPTTGRYQPTTGRRQPTTGRYQPTTGRHQPTTGRYQPTTGRHQPTTGRYQSTTGRRQPTTGRYQSTTGRRQPTTGRYQPTTGRNHPTTSYCPGLSCDNDTKCIHPAYVCDRVRDCYDGSDEICLKSDSKKCKVGEFLCPSRLCVQKHKIDPLDERCFPFNHGDSQVLEKYCTGQLFLCDANRTCIASTKRCDGIVNCMDGTDEMNKNLIVQEEPSFSCANGYCILNQDVCNGFDDCGDSSDEFPFNTNCTVYARRCDSFLDSDELFHCYNGLCVYKMYVHDGQDNCGDSSDERYWFFNCDNGVSINYDQHCDGVNNCGDNSDEQSCPNNQPHTGSCFDHTCNNGVCIDSVNICNGVNDCGDNSDETLCNSDDSDVWIWSDDKAIIISSSVIGGIGLIIACISIYILVQLKKKRIASAQIMFGTTAQPPSYSEVKSSYPFKQDVVSQNTEKGFTNPLYGETHAQP